MIPNGSDPGNLSGFPQDQSEQPGGSGDMPRRGSRREREHQRFKEEIFKAAGELFARFGYEKTSMKQIAEKADLSVGKIYSHFKGKEEIFRELMERHLEELHRITEESCSPNDPPLEQLRCRIESGIEFFKEHSDFMIVYHNESPFRLLGWRREKLMKNMEIVAGLMARAIERGDLPEENPKVLAAILIGSVHRLLDALVESEGKEAFDEVPGIIDRIILKPLEMRRRDASEMEGS